MALINCEECGKEISSQARTCPNCGAPISLATVTIEKTSKEIKTEQLKAGGVMVAGMVILILGGAGSTDIIPLMILGAITAVVGIILLIRVAIRNWWNHG